MLIIMMDVRWWKMKTNLYVIRDMVAEEVGPIFEAKNDAVAHRNFADLLKTAIAPCDFMLYRIATFDRDDMQLSDLVAVNITPDEVIK